MPQELTDITVEQSDQEDHGDNEAEMENMYEVIFEGNGKDEEEEEREDQNKEEEG